MRILIAEDDMISRRVLERTLTKWGYEVVSTRDGAEETSTSLFPTGSYSKSGKRRARSAK